MQIFKVLVWVLLTGIVLNGNVDEVVLCSLHAVRIHFDLVNTLRFQLGISMNDMTLL